jgi:hypothetical protein
MVRFLVLYDMPADPAELDWESTEAMAAAFASGIGRQTGADVANFAPGDTSHSLVFEVAEV